MCKILIASGITTSLTTGSGSLFIKHATTALTESDKDGFGYAALDNQGAMFGERWLDVKQPWNPSNTLSSVLTPFTNVLEGTLTKDNYSSFGTVKLDSVKTIMLHSRASTNTISIQNTHPFVAQGTALIHNGVISNPQRELQLTSTCDSEVILSLYNLFDVVKDIDNMKHVADELQGWYAVGALNESGILDVFKEPASSLIAAHVPELGPTCVVFCTRIDILARACIAAGYAVPTAVNVKSGVLIRMNAFTGQFIGYSKFETEQPYDWTKYHTEYDADDIDGESVSESDSTVLNDNLLSWPESYRRNRR